MSETMMCDECHRPIQEWGESRSPEEGPACECVRPRKRRFPFTEGEGPSSRVNKARSALIRAHREQVGFLDAVLEFERACKAESAAVRKAEEREVREALKRVFDAANISAKPTTLNDLAEAMGMCEYSHFGLADALLSRRVPRVETVTDEMIEAYHTGVREWSLQPGPFSEKEKIRAGLTAVLHFLTGDER